VSKAAKKTAAKKQTSRRASAKATTAPKTLKVYVDEFTVADIIDFEDFVGTPWAAVFGSSEPQPRRVAVALEWIERRRLDPAVTVEQILLGPAKDAETVEMVSGPRPA